MLFASLNGCDAPAARPRDRDRARRASGRNRAAAPSRGYSATSGAAHPDTCRRTPNRPPSRVASTTPAISARSPRWPIAPAQPTRGLPSRRRGVETEPARLLQPVRHDHGLVAHPAVGARQRLGADDKPVAQRQRLFQPLGDIGRDRRAMRALRRQVGDQVVDLEDPERLAGVLDPLDDLDLVPFELALEDDAVGRHARDLGRRHQPHRLVGMDHARI